MCCQQTNKVVLERTARTHKFTLIPTEKCVSESGVKLLKQVVETDEFTIHLHFY